MSDADEMFDYLRGSMIKRECGESEFEWLGRMKAAYARQGFLSPRQVNVLANLAGDEFTAADIHEALAVELKYVGLNEKESEQ